MKEKVKNMLLYLIIGVFAIVLIFAGTRMDRSMISKDVKLINSIPEIPSNEEAIETYLGVVRERVKEVERDKTGEVTFLTDNEVSFLKERGYSFQDPNVGYCTKYNQENNEITKIYYPVIFNNNRKIEIWYLNYQGEVFCAYEKYGEINPLPDKDNKCIMRDAKECLLYNSNSGKVTVWQFGEQIEEYAIPKNAVYIGHSLSEGYIFRYENQVYSLYYNTNGKHNGVTKIASKVKLVLTADYYFDSNSTSQPLFLMEDGSVSAYVKGKIVPPNVGGEYWEVYYPRK